MAKKGQTVKKKIDVLEKEPVLQTPNDNSITIGEISCSEKICDSFIMTIKRRPIETLKIDELMWLEKACALICKKYETTARLDGQNNRKLSEFTVYYNTIINEMETRVKTLCTLPE